MLKVSAANSIVAIAKTRLPLPNLPCLALSLIWLLRVLAHSFEVAPFQFRISGKSWPCLLM